MGKTKSIVITVLLALAMAVAAFFAFISFDVGVSGRYNSILSNISLGADFTGYAYTTVYPEGVITVSDYNGRVDAYENAEEDKKAEMTDPATIFEKYGNYYVSTEEYDDIAKLKSSVAADAKILNARFGEKGYSSYSVAVEDGLVIKISVPTYFSSAQFKSNAEGSYYDQAGRETRFSAIESTLNSLTSYGELMLRAADDIYGLGEDDWSGKAETTDSGKTYPLVKDDETSYFKSVSGGKVGSTPVLTLNLTSKGREKIKELTTKIKNSSTSSDNVLYFFVGDTPLVQFSCTETVDSDSITLQTSDVEMAKNIAITLNSVINGNALKLSYGDVNISTQQSNGELAAILTMVACLLLLAGLAALLVVKYKKLGAITAAIAVLLALVEVYALELLSITVTYAVVFTCALLIALFAVSCAVVYAEVKRLTLTGRTIQASIKEAYKNVIMTVTDLHIVLVIVAILLTTVGVGEVAACGFISIIGVVASYVLYWFTRFMWYVTSSPEKDKFKFAGLKRVVYEDD